MHLSFIMIFAWGLFVSSCTNLNQEAQQEYKMRQGLRHGIVPVAVDRRNIDKNIAPLEAKSVARGKKVYQNHCLSCHGPFGFGDGPDSRRSQMRVKDISRLALEVPNFRFFMMASSWKGEMPGWKSTLTKKEMTDLESYLIHLSKSNNS